MLLVVVCRFEGLFVCLIICYRSRPATLNSHDGDLDDVFAMSPRSFRREKSYSLKVNLIPFWFLIFLRRTGRHLTLCDMPLMCDQFGPMDAIDFKPCATQLFKHVVPKSFHVLRSEPQSGKTSLAYYLVTRRCSPDDFRHYTTNVIPVPRGKTCLELPSSFDNVLVLTASNVQQWARVKKLTESTLVIIDEASKLYSDTVFGDFCKNERQCAMLLITTTSSTTTVRPTTFFPVRTLYLNPSFAPTRDQLISFLENNLMMQQGGHGSGHCPAYCVRHRGTCRDLELGCAAVHRDDDRRRNNNSRIITRRFAVAPRPAAPLEDSRRYFCASATDALVDWRQCPMERSTALDRGGRDAGRVVAARIVRRGQQRPSAFIPEFGTPRRARQQEHGQHAVGSRTVLHRRPSQCDCTGGRHGRRAADSGKPDGPPDVYSQGVRR